MPNGEGNESTVEKIKRLAMGIGAPIGKGLAGRAGPDPSLQIALNGASREDCADPARDPKIEELRKALEQQKYGKQAEAQAAPTRLRTQTLIIAGNHQQAEDYIRHIRVNPIDCTVADDVYRVLGLQVFDVVFVGTWYRRHDLRELFDTLQANVVARRLREDSSNVNESNQGSYDPSSISGGISSARTP